MLRWIALIIALSLVPGAAAQDTGAQAPPETEQQTAPPEPVIDSRFDSPRAAMFTFLEAAQSLAGQRSSAARREQAREELVRVLGLTGAQFDTARDSAAYLIEILNRLGEVRPEQLPDAGEVDASGASIFSYFPLEARSIAPQRRVNERRARNLFPDGRIELERQASGEWRFSDATVADLEEFRDAVKELPSVFSEGVDTSRLSASLWLESFMPEPLVSGRFLGVKYWKWTGLLLLIFVGVLLDFLVRAILRGVVHTAARKRGRTVDAKTVARAVRPFGMLFGAGVVVVGLHMLGLPELGMTILLVAARVIVTFAAILAAYRVTDLFASIVESKASLTKTRIDDLLIPLVRKTVKIFIAAIGVVWLADALSIDVLPLITGLGIGGLAVAFAAKDTIENFFGSVSVILDRPFDVGDWIVVGDVEGTVEELGFRSTRIRTFYNSLVTVPNASLVRANVDNYGRRKYRRLRTHLSIAYNTPPDTIEAFCEGIRELIRQHPYTRKDYYQVWLHQMGAASLDVLLYVFHEVPDWQTELRERQRLLLDIMRLAERMGIEFAFPTQTLYLRQEEWANPDAPEELERESKALQTGRIVAKQIVRGKEWRAEAPGRYEFRGAESVDDEHADDGEGSAIDDRTAGA